MNIPMAASSVTVFTILAITSDVVSMKLGIILLLVSIPIYLIVLKMLRVCGKKTYNFKSNSATKVDEVKTVIAD